MRGLASRPRSHECPGNRRFPARDFASASLDRTHEVAGSSPASSIPAKSLQISMWVIAGAGIARIRSGTRLVLVTQATRAISRCREPEMDSSRRRPELPPPARLPGSAFQAAPCRSGTSGWYPPACAEHSFQSSDLFFPYIRVEFTMRRRREPCIRPGSTTATTDIGEGTTIECPVRTRRSTRAGGHAVRRPEVGVS